MFQEGEKEVWLTSQPSHAHAHGAADRGQLAALVRREAVPDQAERRAPEALAEEPEEPAEAGRVVAPRPGLEGQPSPPAVPPEREGGGHGEVLPVEGVGQHRRVAPRRPGPADPGPLGE